MKLAFIGDIHGNYLALKSVLDAAVAHGVERVLITGDFVGYYFWPKEALELLTQWDFVAVRGNHEDMLADARKNSEVINAIVSKYGTGLRLALEQLDEQQLDMLCNLPHPIEIVVEGCRILLCHGSPWDIDQYIYPDANPELLRQCAMQEFDLIVLGHSHYPMYHKITRTQLVNPGSVGQPRNYKPGAHWTLFNTESKEVCFFCESYDVNYVIAEARQRHPNMPYLSEVLKRV